MSGASNKADSVSFDAAVGDGPAQRFTLRLTPSAWIELEDAGLGDVQTLATTLEEKPSFKTFAKVFAAALRGGMKDRNLSDETAMEIADEIGSEAVISKIGEVVKASFPEAAAKSNDGEAGKGKAQANK